MRKLLIATRNRSKIPEIQKGLVGLSFELSTMDDVGFPADFTVEETAQTFEGNALIKAFICGKRSGLLTLADDSGLSVDALNGEPGVRSARYAPGNDVDRYQKLLDVMKDIPEGKRAAHFTAVIAVYDPLTDAIHTFEGLCLGRIMREPKGEYGFGYDPIFFSDELGATFSEVSIEQKQRGDHRGKALIQAREILKALV